MYFSRDPSISFQLQAPKTYDPLLARTTHAFMKKVNPEINE